VCNQCARVGFGVCVMGLVCVGIFWKIFAFLITFVN